MRLYHHPMSSNARRAVMTALHLGLPVELRFVDLAKGEQRTPAFLRLNPNGAVPVLDDDGFVLTESHAIMQYLADKTPNQTIYPTDIRSRADVNRWMFWSAQHFQPAASILNWEHAVKGFLGLGGPDPAEVAKGEELVKRYSAVLDGHLATRTWVSGDHLSIADYALGATLMSDESARLPVQSFAHLQAWFARIRDLDAWKQTNV